MRALLGVAAAAAAAVASPVAVSPAASCSGEWLAARLAVAECATGIFVTADGRAWRRVRGPAGRVVDARLAFLDARRGWIVGNDCAAGRARVYRTADGGRRWRSAPVPATNCSAGSRLEPFFLDARHGWIVQIFANGNRTFLWRTVDGGARWTSPGEVPFPGSVAFRTARDGWIARSDFSRPAFAVTHDAGRTWRPARIPRPRGWSRASARAEAPVFFGPRRGVLVVDLFERKRTAVAFFSTRDGGRSWRLASVRGVRLRPSAPVFVRWIAVSTPAPSTWWVADVRGRSLFVTADGGRHWSVSRPRRLRFGRSLVLSAADARRAWIDGPPLLATADGGRTWVPVRPR